MNKMYILVKIVLLFLILGCSTSLAKNGKMHQMEAPNELEAIPLKTGGVEDQEVGETWFRQWGDPMVRNVSNATLTPFLADPEKANGLSVIVAPGGGYMWLSMGNEGWEVAEALAAQGINAFVLKYRLQPTAKELDEFETQMKQRFNEAESSSSQSEKKPPRRPRWDLARQIEDVESAYSLMLSRASEWRVFPNKIGMMGFSAGAGLTMETVLKSKKVDLAFIAPIYGSMNEVNVPKEAPPMFNVIAADDFLFQGDFGIVTSWYEAKIPVELHLYQNGGHGFGLGNPGRTSEKWFEAFLYWLDVNNFKK